MIFSTIRRHGTLLRLPSKDFGTRISRQYGNRKGTVRRSFLLSSLSINPPADTFDLLLTRDLTRAHILDFNPYAPRTDPLLFTYDELFNLLFTRHDEHPELRVIDSRTHPAAISNAPAYQHNMVPFEVLSMSNGKDIEEFADTWMENIRKGMKE